MLKKKLKWKMWQTAKHIKQRQSFFPGPVGDGERNFMAADIMATAIMAPLTVASGRCFQTIYFPIRVKGLNVRKQASYMAIRRPSGIGTMYEGTWHSDSFQRNGSTTSTGWAMFALASCQMEVYWFILHVPKIVPCGCKLKNGFQFGFCQRVLQRMHTVLEVDW